MVANYILRDRCNTCSQLFDWDYSCTQDTIMNGNPEVAFLITVSSKKWFIT